MSSNVVGLNYSQVAILKALASSTRGLTRPDIFKAVGDDVAVTPENLGPAYKETLEGNGKYQGSLWGLGLAKPVYDEVDGEMVAVWHATGAGRKLAATVKTRARARKDDKVDPSVLDPVVRKFRATRTYQFELYTDEDMRAIKSALGKHAEGISLDLLRCQMVARRKQGAYADPTAKIKKSVEKAIREFGPEGTIAHILTQEQVTQMLALSAQLGWGDDEEDSEDR